MKKLVFDLDGTLTVDDPNTSYANKSPNTEIINKLREYKSEGFIIIISTARSMRTYNGSIGHINANTLPIIVNWLKKHDIPYDELYVGKPWCGDEGFYIDDKAIRPSELLKYNYCELMNLLSLEGNGGQQPASELLDIDGGNNE